MSSLSCVHASAPRVQCVLRFTAVQGSTGLFWPSSPEGPYDNKLHVAEVVAVASGTLNLCAGTRRYQRGSEMCEKLAKALDHLTNSEDRELFDFGRRAGEASPLVRCPLRCAES